jgi:dihydropyrimidinase
VDFNIFEGMEVTGLPVCTLVNGKVVYRDGQVIGQAGDGQYFDRPAYGQYYDAIQRKNALSEPVAVAR